MRDGDRIDREHLERDFFLEAEEIFEALTESLRALEEACREGRPRPALINTIFREVHSLKGLAGLQGLQEIVDLAHGLEDLLELLRLGRGELTGPRLDLIQEAFDALVTMVRGLAAASGPVVDRSGLRERLRAEASTASGLDSPEARRVLLGLDPRIASSLSASAWSRRSSTLACARSCRAWRPPGRRSSARSRPLGTRPTPRCSSAWWSRARPGGRRSPAPFMV